MKRIFKLRSTLPKYTVGYNPAVMLQNMHSILDNIKLNFKIQTMKLDTFLCLLGGQRSQSIEKLWLAYFGFTESKYMLYFHPSLRPPNMAGIKLR